MWIESMPKQFTRHGAIRLVIQGRASHGDIDNLVTVIPVEAIDEVSADETAKRVLFESLSASAFLCTEEP